VGERMRMVSTWNYGTQHVAGGVFLILRNLCLLGDVWGWDKPPPWAAPLETSPTRLHGLFLPSRGVQPAGNATRGARAGSLEND
jgi:hypothetical protein